MPLLSLPFALLTAALFICCRALPARWRWPLLLCGSLAFYGYAGAGALAWAAGDVALCYIAARAVGRWRVAGKPRWAAAVCVAVAAAQCALMLLRPLPGASFLGLILLGYVLDVHRGAVPAERNPLLLGAFALFYPQAAQGPLVRFEQTVPQLTGGTPLRWDAFCNALLRILWGLLKKLVLADRLAVFVSAAYETPGAYAGGAMWLALLCYAIQLYADFSGCMDVVLGSAALLGIRLPENFARPYLADGFAAYWQRWHITMGAWFRTYVFYPLAAHPALLRLSGGALRRLKAPGAKRAAATLLPLSATWLLVGLWHGFAPHYAVWGLANGALILWESCAGGRFARLPKPARIGCVFAVQLLLRVLFRVHRLADAPVIYGALFRSGGASPLACGLAAADFAVVLIATAVLVFADLLEERRPGYAARLPGPVRFALGLLGLLALAVFGRYGPGYDPAAFFYSQF